MLVAGGEVCVGQGTCLFRGGFCFITLGGCAVSGRTTTVGLPAHCFGIPISGERGVLVGKSVTDATPFGFTPRRGNLPPSGGKIEVQLSSSISLVALIRTNSRGLPIEWSPAIRFVGLVEFVKAKNVTKPQAGHFAKTEAPPVKVIKEVALELDAEGAVAVKAGDRVLVDIFSEARFVDVIGTSKGRGFAGVVRRHGFGGGPKSHGHMFQVQGSIGASSFPSRVFPGQRMPGHMGAAQITVRNLRIRGIDLEENLLMVEGAVPGSREGYVLISKAKTPPRERRGFAGSGTVDPLKASKKAGKRK